MQFFQIANNLNKKGGMGLTDFFSILAFALSLIVFYLTLKFTIGNTVFALSGHSKNTEDSISLLNILRTPVKVDNVDMNIAELIALSNFASTKSELLEKTLVQTMHDSFGTSVCSIICINGKQFKGKGCDIHFGTQACSSNTIKIPSHDGKLIEVSFESDVQPLNLQFAP